MTPFGQRGGAVLLEDIAAVEVTVLVEVIVDRGMGSRKLVEGIVRLTNHELADHDRSRYSRGELTPFSEGIVTLTKWLRLDWCGSFRR